MEKTTVLARLRFSIEFTEQTIFWMNQNFPRDAWFVKDEGSLFLQEFGGRWQEIIEKIISQETSSYFSELGIPQDYLPFVSHGETYKGSWIMEAAIVMSGSIGQSYSILKKTSKELPTIAEGLSGLRNKILKRVEPTLSRTVSENLYSVANNSIRKNSNIRTDELSPSPSSLSPTQTEEQVEQRKRQIERQTEEQIEQTKRQIERQIEAGLDRERKPALPPFLSPPTSLITTNFTIDARPLAALTPAVLKSHKIHLSVGVSRETYTLENLGNEPLRDVQIGVFTSPTQKNQWSYQDSYMGNFPLVSGKQTVVKPVYEFKDRNRKKLDLSDGDAVYVDCWIQDNHGIYLFQFFLEAE